MKAAHPSRRRPVPWALPLLALCSALAPAGAAAAPASDDAPGRAAVKVLAVRPESPDTRAGELLRVTFDLEAPHPWHFYPAAKTPLLGKQTVFEFDGAEVAGPIVEPRPRYKRRGVLESDFHAGRVTITVPVRLAAGTPVGTRELAGRVVYQICDWNLCLNGQAPFRFGLRVVGGGTPAPTAAR